MAFDLTIRCMQCGQPDEPGMHDNIACGHRPQVLREISNERWRQVAREDYSLHRDDGYTLGELGLAAALYALPYEVEVAGEKLLSQDDYIGLDATLALACDWKLKPEPDRRRRLIKAAAMLVAEVERLDRQAARGGDAAENAR